mgnify:CR=1 FL=1
MYNFALAFVLCAAVYIIGEVVSTQQKHGSIGIRNCRYHSGGLLDSPSHYADQRRRTDSLWQHNRYLSADYAHGHRDQHQAAAGAVEDHCGLPCGTCGYVRPGTVRLPPAHGPQLCCRGTASSHRRHRGCNDDDGAANAAGLKEAAVFAIAMYCVQGFAGYPLTAVCLQLEGKKLLKEYRNAVCRLPAFQMR